MAVSNRMPYLTHTGYEFPLLLDGLKKLARMLDLYPPMTFKGEDRFEHWVAKGELHREEVNEPFDKPIQSRGQTYLGHRTVYYTPKGEEWRFGEQTDLGCLGQIRRLEQILRTARGHAVRL